MCLVWGGNFMYVMYEELDKRMALWLDAIREAIDQKLAQQTSILAGVFIEKARSGMQAVAEGIYTRLDRIEGDVAVLKTDVAVLKIDMGRVKADLGRVKQRLEIDDPV